MLAQDWYYRHALFDRQEDSAVLMTFGEDEPQMAYALVRWLGPGAELLAPEEWREGLRAELQAMLVAHGG